MHSVQQLIRNTFLLRCVKFAQSMFSAAAQSHGGVSDARSEKTGVLREFAQPPKRTLHAAQVAVRRVARIGEPGRPQAVLRHAAVAVGVARADAADVGGALLRHENGQQARLRHRVQAAHLHQRVLQDVLQVLRLGLGFVRNPGALDGERTRRAAASARCAGAVRPGRRVGTRHSSSSR